MTKTFFTKSIYPEIHLLRKMEYKKTSLQKWLTAKLAEIAWTAKLMFMQKF